MRYLIVLLLSGCKFAGHLPQTIYNTVPDRSGNTCITTGKAVGEVIDNLHTGLKGPIIRIYGTSSRCTDQEHPILADVDYR